MASNLRSPSQNLDNNGKVFHPSIQSTPGFNADADTEVLCKSMRIWGTDEDAIIKILGRRTSAERQAIVNLYKTKFGRTLAHDLCGDLSGHFCDLAILLTEAPIYLMAKSLFYAVKGVGTNEKTIFEILVGCTNDEIIQLKKAYVHVLRDKGIKDPKRCLEGDIRSETSGYFCKLLLQILKGETMDPTPQQLATLKSHGGDAIVDANDVSEKIKMLVAVLQKEGGIIDHATLLAVFKNKNIWQISAITKGFEKAAAQSLVATLTAKVTEDEFKNLLVALVEHATNRSKFYSDLLHASMVGAGTRDFLLMRVMILRSEIDMNDIVEIFNRDYQSLEAWIKGDTGADYEKLLLTLLNIQPKK